MGTMGDQVKGLKMAARAMHGASELLYFVPYPEGRKPLSAAPAYQITRGLAYMAEDTAKVINHLISSYGQQTEPRDQPISDLRTPPWNT